MPDFEDKTAAARMKMIADGEPEKQLASVAHGRMWTKDELQADFEVQGFLAPFVIVKRKADNRVGSMMFANKPDGNRVYFNFEPDSGAD